MKAKILRKIYSMKIKKELQTKVTNKIKKNNKTLENFLTGLKHLHD